MDRRPTGRAGQSNQGAGSLPAAPAPPPPHDGTDGLGLGVMPRPAYRPARGRKRHRRGRWPLGGRGCATSLGVGALALLLALLLGAVVIDRAVSRFTARALPTPTRTPDITPLGPGPVLGPPSIDAATIRRVLESYGSPAAGEAQTFYDLGVARGIDPAYCLAFFIVESSAGTRGVARTTYSIGNIRARPGEPSYEGYRLYTSWAEGIADWYRLIDELYVGQWGLTTIDAIVPVYAPQHDSNDPAAYARTVKRLVAGWRGL